MLSNKEQFEHIDSPIMKSDMISNNEQFNTVVGHGMEMINMNEGISQTFNVDQMMQCILPGSLYLQETETGGMETFYD